MSSRVCLTLAVAALTSAVGAAVVIVIAMSMAERYRTVSTRRIRPAASATGVAAARQTTTLLLPAPTKLAEGVYVLGDMFPSAVYVVDTSEGVIMIDSGLEAQYPRLRRGLMLLGLDIARLKAIFITHAHADHSMGALRLRHETGAAVHAGREDAAALRKGGPPEAFVSKFEMPGVELHPTPVDVELMDGQTFTWGDARFTAIATPGHTHGSFCFLLERSGQRILFAGDTIMSLSKGLGAYPTYLPAKYCGDVHEFLASLKKLRQLAMPDLVLPGHPVLPKNPRDDPPPEDPRLTPSQWERLLDGGIQEMERLAERRDADGADFLDGTPKELLEGLYYLGDFDDRAAYAWVCGSECLLFDAPGGERACQLLDAAWQAVGAAPPTIKAVLLTSCDAASTSGLRSIVERTGCGVVTVQEGVAAVAPRCPPGTKVISTLELAGLEWEPIEALPTPGLDGTAVAYRFRRGEDEVLVTGPVPIDSDAIELPRRFSRLGVEHWDLSRLKRSLDALEAIHPDLWLTGYPLHGRNANLYDDQWAQTILLNQKLVRYARAAHPRSAP